MTGFHQSPSLFTAGGPRCRGTTPGLPEHQLGKAGCLHVRLCEHVGTGFVCVPFSIPRALCPLPSWGRAPALQLRQLELREGRG